MFLLRTKIVNFMVNMYIHRYNNIYRHRINRIYVLYILYIIYTYVYYIVVFQSLSCVQLFATPWTTGYWGSLSFTISWSLLKLMSVMPSNHLILCHPLLLLPSIFSSFRVFSNESALLMS